MEQVSYRVEYNSPETEVIFSMDVIYIFFFFILSIFWVNPRYNDHRSKKFRR